MDFCDLDKNVAMEGGMSSDDENKVWYDMMAVDGL